MLDKAVDASFLIDPQAGVYILRFKGVIVYIGQTEDLVKRIHYHQARYKSARKGVLTPNGPKSPHKIIKFDEISFIYENNEAERLEVEWLLIAQYKPKHNIQGNRLGSTTEKEIYSEKRPVDKGGAKLLKSLGLK